MGLQAEDEIVPVQLRQLPETQGFVQPLRLFVASFGGQLDGLGGICRFEEADRQPRGTFSIALSQVVSVNIEAPGIGVALAQPPGQVDESHRPALRGTDDAGTVILREQIRPSDGEPGGIDHILLLL